MLSHVIFYGHWTLYRVKEILRGHDQRTPLFLYVALQAVHTPLQAPGHLLRRYQTLGNRPRRHYAAMVSGVDESVGEIVSELREQGFYNNSVLIYSSDNGGQPLSGGCNWPLRGGKGSYWEGGVRAVGFVHSPLLKRKGVVSQALIHISDWYPTLLSLAGYRESDSSHLDGQDVWGAISSGLPCPRTEILFNIDPVSRKHGEVNPRLLNLNGFGIWDTGVRAAIRVGDWKLLTGNVGDWRLVSSTDNAGRPAAVAGHGKETRPAREVCLAFQRHSWSLWEGGFGRGTAWGGQGAVDPTCRVQPNCCASTQSTWRPDGWPATSWRGVDSLAGSGRGWRWRGWWRTRQYQQKGQIQEYLQSLQTQSLVQKGWFPYAKGCFVLVVKRGQFVTLWHSVKIYAVSLNCLCPSCIIRRHLPVMSILDKFPSVWCNAFSGTVQITYH